METKVFKIKSYENFIDLTEVNNYDSRIRLYRGQKDDKKLFPKLLRLVEEKKRLDEFYEIEKRILRQFKEFLCQNTSKIKEYNEYDILALAQHFGLPTRLLDWSSNPLIALWFAFESDKNNNDDRIVWGLIVEEDLYPIDMENDSPFNRRFIKVIEPKPIDPRIIAQKAWFSIQNVNLYGDGGNGLPVFNTLESMDELEEFEYQLAKFIIPNSLRTEILNKLDIKGVNYCSLFPDLEGLCKYIEWKEFK